jgi:hypothetical protein
MRQNPLPFGRAHSDIMHDTMALQPHPDNLVEVQLPDSKFTFVPSQMSMLVGC